MRKGVEMIEVKNLSKHFGSIRAVENISFQVEKGEILGFLGPNGAGKSTTMRMITGFIPPTKGTAVIGGHDILTDSLQARKKMGYLPENAPVYPDMTVKDYLGFCAEIRGFYKQEKKNRVDGAIEKCFLEKVRNQTIQTLSKGYRQRVCFAQAILHDPEYLIMDEPTDGLDPNQKHEVREMIRRMSADKAIILSTHILDEMDAVCSRAIIISGGQVVADETPASLKTRSEIHGSVTVSLSLTDPRSFLGAAEKISGVKSLHILENEPENLKVRIYPEDGNSSVAKDVIRLISDSGYEMKSIFVDEGRLDEVFRDITQTENQNLKEAAV